jgi:hypothetical protein
MKRLLIVLAVLAALGGTAEADSGHDKDKDNDKDKDRKPHVVVLRGADIKAALVRCADVTFPAPLPDCGDDPLTRGRLEVSRAGDVSVLLVGARPASTYDLILHAAGNVMGNVSTALPIAVLVTDALGNAAIRWASVFDTGQAGIVAFTLSRNGSVEFVAGFRGEQELEATLVPCADINTPAPLPACGTDTFTSGKAKVDDGDVTVELSAEPNTSYTVVFRGLRGGNDSAIGIVFTDKKGKGFLKVKNVVDDDVTGAGNIVLQRDGFDQFITGFQSIRKRPAVVARFQVGLLQCADVNTLAPLTGCGFDQLNKGEVVIDDKGDVNVHVMGAVPRSRYEIFFVSEDATTEVSVGILETNPAGNGHAVVRDFFPVGARGVGQVILKRDGVDQFVTGFAVSR